MVTKDGDGGAEQARWIFACAQRDVELRELGAALESFQLLRPVGIFIEPDRAPNNKHARALSEWLDGKNKGGGKRTKTRS